MSPEDDGSSSTRPSRRRFLGLAAAGLAGLAGCAESADSTQSPPTETTRTPTTTHPPTTARPIDYDTAVAHDIEAWARYDPDWQSKAPATSPLATPLDTEILVENLEIPWDLSFAADGTLFITERVGRVLAFDGDAVRTVATPSDAIDAGSVAPGADEGSWWVKGGEGGTLGIAAHPSYPDPPLVYVYYTYKEGGEKYNKVAYFDMAADDPGTRHEPVVDGIPADTIHNGGRITFGPENYLWITCGDAGNHADAQDLSTLAGKVLRVTPSGDPAPGNPDLGTDADPRIVTYGHRNPQGIVWLPDGTPVVSEHGPGGRDEFNRLEPGANYGWPDVRKRHEYLDAPDVHRPLVNSGSTSWAPTGALFYTGDAVPSLRYRLLTGGLISQRLLCTTLTPPKGDLPPATNGLRFDQSWTDPAYTATVHTTFRNRLGRIRHVEQGPDGGLYVITSNRDGRAKGAFPRERDDVLVRVVPGETDGTTTTTTTTTTSTGT